jgi:hypothetical protein
MELAEARALAEKYLDERLVPPDGMRYAIKASAIKATPDGWYFPWQTSLYLETGDIEHSVVGSWPIFVSKNGDEVGPRRPR